MDENNIVISKQEYVMLLNSKARLDLLKGIMENCGYVSDEVIRTLLDAKKKEVRPNED